VAVPRPRRADRVAAQLEDLRRPRWADAPLEDFVELLADSVGNPGRPLAWLAVYGETPGIQQGATTVLFVGCGDRGPSPDLARRMRRTARPVLHIALRDASVCDDRKLAIAPLLMLCGGRLGEDEYTECFRDFEAACERLRERARQELVDTLETADRCLSSVGLLAREDGAPDTLADERPEVVETHLREALAFGLALAEDKPTLGALVLGVIAACASWLGDTSEVADLAVDAAVATDTGRAAWALGELSRWPGDMRLQLRASFEAAELRDRGVAPRGPYTGDFSHGWVSAVDGTGARHVQLYFRTPEGEMDGLLLLLHDQAGLVDAWCLFRDAAGVEALVRGGAAGELSFAPCSLAFARELVAHAWAIHHEHDAPPPGRFFLYRPYLGASPLRPRRRRPRLGAYMIESWVRGPELAEGTGGAVEDAGFGGLWSSSEGAYGFVARALDGPGGDDVAIGEASDAVTDAFIHEVMAPERENLLDRLADNLELAALAGRAREPLSRAAARAWIVLTEDLVPFSRVPYIRALARRGMQEIAKTLILTDA
jgi:hypothetical protein